MKVKEIQIDGFGVWTGLTVDSLEDGMTMFYGPNEAGKTTLMQFVRAMLYGFSSQRQGKYLPPVFGGSPGGALQVSCQGEGYKIRRQPPSIDGAQAGQLSVTGKDGLRQGQHRLSGLLGQIDEATFTNVFAIGLRELQELSTLDDTAAADELYKLSSGVDRVSLVDVIRSLRKARADAVGHSDPTKDPDGERLSELIEKRERLRREVQEQTHSGALWSELASQKLSQQHEIQELTQRIALHEHEARCVEVATGVYENWCQRRALEHRIETLRREGILPDEAPEQLAGIESEIEESRIRLEEIKEKRREIRHEAEQYPVSRRLSELQGRIEAASQLVPWIETLEEQVSRLDEQIAKARRQVELCAERLGLEQVDWQAFLNGQHESLPDLSSRSIATLSMPAKQVKEQLFLMRQARSQAKEHQASADRIGEVLGKVLEKAHAADLQQAIRNTGEEISTLRNRTDLGEHLHNLKRHYRDLERETVELTTAEALPVDRLFLLAVPFIFGGMSLVYGVAHVIGLTFLVTYPDTSWGLLCILMGFMGLMFYYFGREKGQHQTGLDRESCEHQIDSVRRQIREVESECAKIDAAVSGPDGSLEVQVREKEVLLAELEATLPTYHLHEAAKQAVELASSQGSKAAVELKKAKSSWSDALESLGLSRSMSPSTVKTLKSRYEQLQASARRLDQLQEEQQQRQQERRSIANRIENLYFEAMESNREDRWSDEADEEALVDERMMARMRSGPVDQLKHLEEELSRQMEWVECRRELKEQDLQLKKQQNTCELSLELGEQQRRSLWVKCGVESAEQFNQFVDRKSELTEANQQHTELDYTITQMIGAHFGQEEIAEEIEGATVGDLEKRWESLTAQISETENRVSQLQIQKGELTQQMKHLAEDGRLAVCQIELGCVERKIESVIRRWQALATASFLLQDVCAAFEKERQPETLREASNFLEQLTNGKYKRVWTPLGTNQLKIDDAGGEPIRLEFLSRGTREAVFVALRLSLVATYARRGVALPLVLDDVLVNFDQDRALYAAKTLKSFSDLGHQVLMFTCHQHIVEMFKTIGVEIRIMPPHGTPGRAVVLGDEPTDGDPSVTTDDELDVSDSSSVSQTRDGGLKDHGFDGSVEPLSRNPTKVDDEERAIQRTSDTRESLDSIEDNADRSIVSPSDSDGKPDPAVGGIQWAWFERDPEDFLRDPRDSTGSESDDGVTEPTAINQDNTNVDGVLEDVEAEEEYEDVEDSPGDLGNKKEAVGEEDGQVCEHEDGEYEDDEQEDDEQEDDEYEDDEYEDVEYEDVDEDSDDSISEDQQEVA